MYRATLVLLLTVIAATTSAQTYLGNDPHEFCPASGGTTEIEFELLAPTAVTLEVVDSWSQQRVKLLLEDNAMAAGYHQVAWDGRNDQGEILETRVFEIWLRGDDWQVNTGGAINCGDDLGPPVRERAGAKDVTLAFWASLPPVEDASLALYESDGITLVDHLYDGPANQMLGLIWAPLDAPGAPLAAGDYICRLTSSAYSEDVIFHLDPVTPAAMTAVIRDGDGNLVTGLDDSTTDSAQIYGPLQEAWLSFDRALSAPELEYLLDTGLRITGRLENAGPADPVVAPDSASIHFASFTPDEAWSETLGTGTFYNYGFLSPGTARFRLGFHHAGYTRTAASCAVIGEPDPDDWQTDEWHNIDIPCPNAVAPDLSTEFTIYLPEDGPTGLRIFDAEGHIVRTFVWGELSGGSHHFIWDLTDDQGALVIDGIYHLVWTAYDQLWQPFTVTAGDIRVWSLSGVNDDLPMPAAGPQLLPNRPNPFNPSTTIAFILTRPGHARLTVHALDGSLVNTLVDAVLPIGERSAIWNGKDAYGAAVPSGVYLSRLETDGEVLSRRMLVLK